MVSSSLGMLWFVVTSGMPLTMFMECVHAKGPLIGLVMAVQTLAMVAQIPGAYFGEMLQTRKRFWGIVALIHRAVWFVPPLLLLFVTQDAAALGIITVWVSLLSAVFCHASASTWWSWMTDLIPENARGAFWSKRQSLVSCAIVVATIGAGYVLDVFPDPRHPGGTFTGYVIVFGIAALFGCADIITHLWVPEPAQHPARNQAGFWQRLWQPMGQSDFRMLTIAMTCWSFSTMILGQFGLLYLSREFGITYTQLSMLTVSASLGAVLAGFAWGYVMDRLGARNFGLIMMCVAPLCGIFWLFLQPTDISFHVLHRWSFSLPQPVVLLIIANFVAGIFYSGVGLCQISLLGALAPAEGRTMAMAVHWSVIGLVSAIGPVIGGYIMDWINAMNLSWRLPTGMKFSFFHALILAQCSIAWLVALPLLLKVKRRTGEMTFRMALSRFFIVNPFRLAHTIYNIYSMETSDTRSERAAAVRRLGEVRTALALKDLIGYLDDLAPSVREEAMLALGRIGSEDAVEALLAHLDDPAAVDYTPEIARALRLARSRQAVGPLASRLEAADRETACEIARTLGVIGDRRASAALIKRLKESEDPKLVMVCSEALVRLGEFSAVYEILPRMKTAQNRLLNRALAVDVGDLLGQPGSFYRILAREQRAKGAESERMANELARGMRHLLEGRPAAAELARVLGDIRALDAAYVEGRNEEGVQLLYRIGVFLAEHELGIKDPGDPDALVEALVMREERFAVGMWFLSRLRFPSASGGVSAVDDTDILLGIYFLAAWLRKYA